MIGRRYGAFGQRAMASSAPQTAIGVTAGGSNLKRPAIYDITLGSSGAPADNAFLYEAQRFTASGTGTALVPNFLDPGDTAADCVVAFNHTIDPTLTAATIIGYWPVNQRATHRWIADPLGPMIGAGTTANGIAIWGTHASSTVNWSAMIHFFE